jgi:hypothetical protein
LGQSLSILLEFRLKLLDLRFEDPVLLGRGLRDFLELADFSLKVFEMLFLSFTECSLGRSILRLSLLSLMVSYG